MAILRQLAWAAIFSFGSISWNYSALAQTVNTSSGFDFVIPAGMEENTKQRRDDTPFAFRREYTRAGMIDGASCVVSVSPVQGSFSSARTQADANAMMGQLESPGFLKLMLQPRFRKSDQLQIKIMPQENVGGMRAVRAFTFVRAVNGGETERTYAEVALFVVPGKRLIVSCMTYFFDNEKDNYAFMSGDLGRFSSLVRSVRYQP